MFYNRVNELNELARKYGETGAQLLVVSGRKRVGKTTLLKNFVKNKPHIYFLATLTTESEQLATFSQRLRLFSNERLLPEKPFNSWPALFEQLGKLARKIRLIVIIDEFQNLVTATNSFFHFFRKAWQEHLKTSNIFLVFCTSSAFLLEQGWHSPLSFLKQHQSGEVVVPPLSFAQAAQFFTRYDFVSQALTYGILGGIPAYLKQFDVQWSVQRNVLLNILQPDAYLYNEPPTLLMQELREPRNYFAILKAIAAGNKRLPAIVKNSALDRGMVVKYLETLRKLQIVQRELPVQETQPEKSRKGLYRITDAFVRFWFRFVLPNQGFVEEGRADYALKENIWPQMDSYMKPAFEEICKAFLKQKSAQGEWPFTLSKIGRFWQNQVEIDLVGFDQNKTRAVVADCHWSVQKSGTEVLERLQIKAQHPFFKQFREVYFVLFSRSGFTEIVKAQAKSKYMLFDLGQVVAFLLQNNNDER